MNRVTKLLNIEYPIIQGAMARIAMAPLVGAVSNAGGLGVIASGGMSADMLREEIRKTKTITNKPFAVNLMLLDKSINELVDVLIEEGIKIVTTGAGNPKPYMENLKQNGIIVIPVVPTATIAKKMEAIGADAVVAEGMEAGGHVGELTTMALTRQVTEAVSIPVLAAGGIADGHGVVAAWALGAEGVQIGTRFLASEECPVPNTFKEMIVGATDTSTVLTGRRAGHPVRVIKNKMTDQYLEIEYGSYDHDALEAITVGSLRRAVVDGDMETGSIMAGQISGLVSEVKPVKTIIEELIADSKRVLSEIDLSL